MSRHWLEEAQASLRRGDALELPRWCGLYRVYRVFDPPNDTYGEFWGETLHFQVSPDPEPVAIVHRMSGPSYVTLLALSPEWFVEEWPSE